MLRPEDVVKALSKPNLQSNSNHSPQATTPGQAGGFDRKRRKRIFRDGGLKEAPQSSV